MCLGTFSRRGAVACATTYHCAECASSPEGFLCNRKFLEIFYYMKRAALPRISPHYRTAGSFLDGRLLSHSRSNPDVYAVVIAKHLRIPSLFLDVLPYFTVTLQVTFLDPDFTVITAVPFFTPFTTPLALTVATFLFDEL